MRVWIVATFACATLISCAVVRSLASSSARPAVVAFQRRVAHVEIALGSRALPDESGAASHLGLGEADLRLPARDRGPS